MFVLHMDLSAKAGCQESLMSAYRDVLCPLIAQQPGFLGSALLVARSGGSLHTHRLVIAFEREDLQQEWVTTEHHDRAWQALEPTLSTYSMELFDSRENYR
jgi:hypothetical protein